MSINYAVTKKVDKSKGIAKERYYATTRALQKKPVNSVQIANQLAERSSLQNGDVLSALTQLSDIIAAHLKEGRTVSIDGLGNFYPSITSEAVDKPEECTANKVWVSRICFKAAPAFLNGKPILSACNLNTDASLQSHKTIPTRKQPMLSPTSKASLKILHYQTNKQLTIG